MGLSFYMNLDLTLLKKLLVVDGSSQWPPCSVLDELQVKWIDCKPIVNRVDACAVSYLSTMCRPIVVENIGAMSFSCFHVQS